MSGTLGSSSIRLDQIRVASPCTEPWDGMTGDEKSRRCARCNLNVHNLTAMTRAEAEAFLARAGEGRVCVRFFQRHDGTVLTQDCPVGVARARAALRRGVARIAAALGLLGAGTAMGAAMEQRGAMSGRLRDWRPIAAVAEWLVPSVPPMPPAVRRGGMWIAGMRCAPPAPIPPGTSNTPPPGGAMSNQ
ncbi:MAG: hypothetical protein AB7G11_10590 [Phycisphaerales bacterium]